MHHTLLKILLIASVACLSGCTVRITGLYSNMRSDSGVVRGLEVFVIRGSGDSYYAVMQCADGQPGKPVVLQATLDFHTLTLPPAAEPESKCPNAPFRAEIGPSGMVGGFGGSEQLELDRRQSIWQ